MCSNHCYVMNLTLIFNMGIVMISTLWDHLSPFILASFWCLNCVLCWKNAVFIKFMRKPKKLEATNTYANYEAFKNEEDQL